MPTDAHGCPYRAEIVHGSMVAPGTSDYDERTRREYSRCTTHGIGAALTFR
jgi:hypothetical protein